MRGKNWSTGTTACDICHHVLNEWSRGDEKRYSHPGGTFHDDGTLFNHKPVPVPVTTIESVQTVCDMCCVVPATWVYDGPDIFDYGPKHKVKTSGEWGICDICDYLIQHKQLEKLWDRLMQYSPNTAKVPPAERPTMRRNIAKINMKYIQGIWRRERSEPEPYFRPSLRPAALPKIRDRAAKIIDTDAFAERLRRAALSDEGAKLPGIILGKPEQPAVNINGDVDPQHLRDFCHRIANHLYIGDITYINAQFSRLVRLVAYDLDDMKLFEENLPDGETSGLIVWEEPIAVLLAGDERPLDVIAASWMRIPGGIWTSFYTHPKQIWPGEDPVEQAQTEGWLTMIAPGDAIPFAGYDSVTPRSKGLLTGLLATFIFLNQPGVAESEPVTVDKDIRKQYGRTNRKPPAVKYVYLRKRPKKVRETPVGVGKKWEYRRYVKAHAKEQAYGPGWSLHRTIIVSPYLAGDEDLPLRVNDGNTVKILK